MISRLFRWCNWVSFILIFYGVSVICYFFAAELLLREAVSSSRYQTGIWKQNDIHQ